MSSNGCSQQPNYHQLSQMPMPIQPFLATASIDPRSPTSATSSRESKSPSSYMQLHLQNTSNPPHFESGTQLTQTKLNDGAATGYGPPSPAFHEQSHHQHYVSVESLSSRSSCEEDAKESIKTLKRNMNELDKLSSFIQNKHKFKKRLRERLFRSQLQAKEKEITRLTEAIERERKHNNNQQKTIERLLKHQADRTSYDKAMKEVEIRNSEIDKLKREIDRLKWGKSGH